ncbi:MAG: hypothetical protein H6718_24905 [Polyangiaceae bacterium]|nr:hypothetical protein [Polyangiaceae bacterium]MCB9605231.1 hypothetical protein [Polyangiaceae bacterium]
MTRGSLLVAALLSSSVLFSWSPASSAQTHEDEEGSLGLNPRTLVRPHGAAEAGVGLLTLPGAEVCVDVTQGCETGDTSLELHAWQLYRANVDLAFGAGLTLALTPSTDAPREDPPGVPRDHARRYFLVEATARYYAVVSRSVESWIGIMTGLVVISDRFTPQDPESDKALVGPPGVTIRTEGYSLALGGGAAFALAPNWSLGTSLRVGTWFLPETPEKSPLGDEASLAGRITMFDIGVNIAYRLNL